jgi:hypothetical protein
LKVGRPLRGLSRQSEKCDVDDPLGRWSFLRINREIWDNRERRMSRLLQTMRATCFYP